MKIDILSKNLMILASAGSGKTYQLGNRVIGLVGVMGVDPERIVALTFTRKAAGEFADAVLSKLAEAVEQPEMLARLELAVGGEIDAQAALAKVVRALPRFQLGTMDGFFSRVVRGFQYELGLTGGQFELVQGPKLEAALTDILGAILGSALVAGDAEEFMHAFRRATLGKEERAVIDRLMGFFGKWHGLWKEGILGCVDQLDEVFPDLPEVGEWERQKAVLASGMRRSLAEVKWTDGRQSAAMDKLIATFEMHTVGSGSMSTAGKLFEGLYEWQARGGPLMLKLYKEFVPGAMVEQAFGKAMELLTNCELAAAVERTRAIGVLVKRYDMECERRLRRRGMLGFDDVKVMMGEWVKSEDARLRREAVDFRLDARYDHWLLDEFQDTSPAEWRGIVPLLDEAASDDEGSVFVVGDKKQAIYGWRGGDVKLFDEVKRRYEEGLVVETMPESWRSCPEVLELVNRVCGDREVIAGLFGEKLAQRWPWEEHVAAREFHGEARVEIVEGKSEERLERMVEIMRELGVGVRELSCGVLVRTNAQLTVVAEVLRGQGFDVIEEGRRLPTSDNPVGVAMFHLVAWLADPADQFSREVVAMSPLIGVIGERFGDAWQAAWEGLLSAAGVVGFAGMLEGLLDSLWAGLSEYGQRRAGDVIGALASFDTGGGTGAREALRWIVDLEVPQSPGTAAVQVMTYHKSKGLGFDVVMLPEIEDRQVPNAGKFDVARGLGDRWLLQPPAAWVRAQVPVLRAAEEVWAEDQRYEAMCVLYVALTRAKRGLYVLLPEDCVKRKKGANEYASPANLLRMAVGGNQTGVVFQSGEMSWVEGLAARVLKSDSEAVALSRGVALRARTTPSGAKKQAGVKLPRSPGGLKFGTELHAVFEKVAWVDDEEPLMLAGEAGELVFELLRVPEVRSLFERRGRKVKLYREQAVEAVLEGKWLSGIVDRLHVFDGGKLVEVIDFKTDAVNTGAELVERYAGQMDAYRKVMGMLYPEAELRCLLLSTKLRKVVVC